MTTEQESGATEALEREIDFRGRSVWVKRPTFEQIAVWKRTVRQMQEADTGSWGADEVLVALERGLKIINSVMANQTDRTWLDDQLLESKIDFAGAAELIQKTVEAFGTDPNNREERRAAAKKPKKAARRKPAKIP